MSICSNVSVTDLDHNGTKEVVIRTIACDFGEVGYTGPYRWSILALTWNGDHFQPLPERLDPPEYRFQAVQDGDVETQRGNYEEAMRFYRQALNDRQLKGWSEELYHQQWDRYTTREGTPTPTPAPVDPNEYAVLSAYIRYRFMLIHIAQGNADQAQAEFEAFQQEVLPGQPGDDYLLLARKFWTAYQPQHNLAAACAATRAYAHDLRKQLLYPIDSTWHGWQVQDYGTLICPFE